jgi:hypothetical protein
VNLDLILDKYRGVLAQAMAFKPTSDFIQASAPGLPETLARTLTPGESSGQSRAGATTGCGR